MSNNNIQLPTYTCNYLRKAGTVDHDDRVWDEIPAFELVETSSGHQIPELSTKVQAFWTDECFYLRFACKDPHFIATMTNHDDPLYEEDVVELFLCETNDLGLYKEFELSPNNVKFDAEVKKSSDRPLDVRLNWNAEGWHTSVHHQPDHSLVIYTWVLPFTNFSGGTPKAGDCWRMNCYRIDRADRQKDSHNIEDKFLAWSPTGAIDFHMPERFGFLKFGG